MDTDPDRWYAFYLSLGRLWRLGLTLTLGRKIEIETEQKHVLWYICGSN
jgi:hypothetical protein